MRLAFAGRYLDAAERSNRNVGLISSVCDGEYELQVAMPASSRLHCNIEFAITASHCRKTRRPACYGVWNSALTSVALNARL